MQKIKYIHFVGIKGVGVAPLAIIAKEAGIQVTGSDVEEVFITDKALRESRIVPLVGFSPDHIKNPDLVITTGSHGGYDNVEVIAAREKGIPILTKGEAVGEYMDGEILGRKFTGVAVAGSHGKTTTSAILTTIFKECGKDPSYVVGSGSIGEDAPPGHLGKGSYFIAESDEYATEPKYNHRAQFLWSRPSIALFTNIEHDHPDIYPSLDSVILAFQEFVGNIKEGGLLVGNADDPRVDQILKNYKGRSISYGLSPRNDYVLTRIHASGGQTFFHVLFQGTDLGEFRILLSGEHNALNALGAVVIAIDAGLPLEIIKPALVKFTGAKRRLEYRGQLITGAHIFDDYAHHPTEIRSTLKALRMRYPKEKIIAVFQPHTYSRTKALLYEFATAFDVANQVIITDIFASAREGVDESVSSKILIEEMAKHHHNVLYLPTPSDAAVFITSKHFGDGVVIVFMGAGDIYHGIEALSFKE